MTRVLIIEDEESYREATAFMLRKEGFEVNTAANGADGLEIYSRNGADIVLLDLMMPGLPGTEVCRQLRQRGNVGIIMVTARDSEIDKVVGLELGADDYVTKPFSHRELVARIRAVTRRGSPEVEVSPDVLEESGVRMDVERHEVSVEGTVVRLALKEFDLLEGLSNGLLAKVTIKFANSAPVTLDAPVVSSTHPDFAEYASSGIPSARS